MIWLPILLVIIMIVFLQFITLSLLSVNLTSSFFFFSSRRRHTSWNCDWSSDVCSSDLIFGTDPVAIDTIELGKIEAKRSKEGVPSVWSRDPASLTNDGGAYFRDASKNLFYRQPHHIAAAGKLGLGISDRKKIELRSIGIA